MATVTWRKRGKKWQLRFRHNNSEKVITLNGNLTERQVKTLAMERELAWNNGTYDPYRHNWNAGADLLTETLADCVFEYCSEKQSEWSKNSQYNKSKTLEGFVDFVGISKEPKSITPFELTKYIKSFKKYSEKTIAGYVATVNAFLSWLHDKGYTTDKLKIDYSPKIKKSFPDILSEQEVIELAKYMSAYSPEKGKNAPKSTNKQHYADYIIVYFYTGLRTDELAHIKVGDINLASRSMIVGKNKPTKDKEERIIYLVSQVIPVLETMMKGKATTDYITANRDMKRVSRLFSSLIEELYPHKDVTLYNLRHSCGCWLLEQGISLEAVATQFGHADVRTTRIYAQMTNRAIKNEFERLLK